MPTHKTSPTYTAGGDCVFLTCSIKQRAFDLPQCYVLFLHFPCSALYPNCYLLYNLTIQSNQFVFAAHVHTIFWPAFYSVRISILANMNLPFDCNGWDKITINDSSEVCH